VTKVLDDLEQSLQEFPQDEREELGSAFLEVLGALQSTVDSLPPPDRRDLLKQLTEAIEGVGALVVVGSSDSMKGESVMRLLGDLLRPEGEVSVGELEKLNTQLGFEQWRKAITESFSTAELEEKLGVSRQQLSNWRRARKLVWLEPPFERGFFYPAWEFDDRGRPYDLIPALSDASDEARLDALSLHRLMVSETATPRGPLMFALRDGEDDYVLEVVNASSAQGT